MATSACRAKVLRHAPCVEPPTLGRQPWGLVQTLMAFSEQAGAPFMTNIAKMNRNAVKLKIIITIRSTSFKHVVSFNCSGVWSDVTFTSDIKADFWSIVTQCGSLPVICNYLTLLFIQCCWRNVVSTGSTEFYDIEFMTLRTGLLPFTLASTVDLIE